MRVACSIVAVVAVLVGGLAAAGCNDHKRPTTMLPPPAVLQFSTTSVPLVVNGTLYQATFSVTGSSGGGVVFTLTSGSLPPGLVLDPAGSVFGTPTITAGAQFPVRVRAVDQANGASVEKDFVFKTPKAVTITTTVLGAVLGQPVTGGLQAAGGTQPYTWSFVSGTLPPGVTVQSTGLLAGATSTLGTFFFTVRVLDTADAEGQVSDQKQVQVNVQ